MCMPDSAIDNLVCPSKSFDELNSLKETLRGFKYQFGY